MSKAKMNSTGAKLPFGVEKRVKVKLKDLKPNPFRNFEINPINLQRVKDHVQSIKAIGCWLTPMVRKQGQNYELVFGHHRVEALKEIYGEDFEIEVEVASRQDYQMLKTLAMENDPVWNHSILEIDEMVSGAKRQLEDMKKNNPKALRKIAGLSPEPSGDKKKRVRIGYALIAKFLGWKESRVEQALTRMNSIKDGVVDRGALYAFPTASSAMTFLRIMKSNAYDIKKKDQSYLAQEIIRDGRRGERSMERAVNRFEKWRRKDGFRLHEGERGDAEYCERVLEKITKSIKNTMYWMEEFGMGTKPFGFFPGVPTIEDIRPKTIEDYDNILEAFFRTKAKMVKHFEELQRNVELKDGEEPMPEKAVKAQMEREERKEKEAKEAEEKEQVGEKDIAKKIREQFEKVTKSPSKKEVDGETIPAESVKAQIVKKPEEKKSPGEKDMAKKIREAVDKAKKSPSKK